MAPLDFKMLLILMLLSSIITLSSGVSKFIIDNYYISQKQYISWDIPTDLVDESTLNAYPLDMCIVYGHYQILYPPPNNNDAYIKCGIYSCDTLGSSVSFKDYGQDCSCTTYDGTNDAIFSKDNSLSPGSIGTFNCYGESNWMETWSFYILSSLDVTCNDDISIVCCPLEWLDIGGSYEYFPLGVITATGVCVDGSNGYQAAECGLGFGFVYTWDTNTCDGNKLLPTESAQNTCELKLESFNYDINSQPTSRLCTYNLLYGCYQNGVAIDTQTECAATPTASGTFPPDQISTTGQATSESRQTTDPSSGETISSTDSKSTSTQATTASGSGSETTDPSTGKNTDAGDNSGCEAIGGDGCIKYFDGCNECFCNGDQKYCTNLCVSITRTN